MNGDTLEDVSTAKREKGNLKRPFEFWLGVAFLLLLFGWAVYQLGTIEQQKTKIAVECNEYWRAELIKFCPYAVSGYNPEGLNIPS